MNFFKTVFSDEPDSPPHGSDDSDHRDPDQDTATATETSTWSFGGLIQTLASKSESVLENYRRDLEEFGSGLRDETAVIREAASRAVKDFPASLDVGASVAQESLESVGQAIDEIGTTVWKSTAQIISHGRDSLLASDSFDSDSYDSSNDGGLKKQLSSSTSDLKRYSRFDALLRALQSDVNTYLEEPEDLGNFNEWKLGFEFDKKEEEIENLIEENGIVEEIYEKVVPSKIDHESFWIRYFYKLHKLKQAEEARAKLVKRAISGDEEEDLSWDVDDDDDNGGYEAVGSSSKVSELKEKDSAEVATGAAADVEIVDDLKIENDEKGVAFDSKIDGGKIENDEKGVAFDSKIDGGKIENDEKGVASDSKIDGRRIENDEKGVASDSKIDGRRIENDEKGVASDSKIDGRKIENDEECVAFDSKIDGGKIENDEKGVASDSKIDGRRIENDEKGVASDSKIDGRKIENDEKGVASDSKIDGRKIENDEKGVASDSKTDGGYKLKKVNSDENVAANVPAALSEQQGDKLDVKTEASEAKTDSDNGDSSKDSDISIVSSQPSMPEEEDIGWDEIEEIESNDENRGDAVGSASRVDLRKRLSEASADQDEDLSWDIEDDDDDEVVKS